MKTNNGGYLWQHVLSCLILLFCFGEGTEVMEKECNEMFKGILLHTLI